MPRSLYVKDLLCRFREKGKCIVVVTNGYRGRRGRDRIIV